MIKLLLILVLLSITTSAFAFGHRVFRWTDEDGQARVMRCYPNGQCTVE